jgi:DNA polymerase-3 subunit beta
MIASVDADITEEGGITIPAKILNEILKELPEENLSFSVDDNYKVTLISKFGQYKIAGESQNQFPPQPNIESLFKLEINGSVFKHMINKTSFAIGADVLRPALMGGLFQISDEEIRMVATDGHRLAKFSNKSIKPGLGKAQIIIPNKGLNFLSRTLTDESTILITFNKTYAMFSEENLIIYSKLISDDYPDFEKAIPYHNSKTLHVNLALLSSSVRRVSLFSSPLTSQIRIHVENQKLLISAEDVDTGGEGHEEVLCNFDDSESLDIGFNAIYLSDVLKHMDCEEITLKLQTPTSGILAFPLEQKNDEELLMLIMPVRLTER